MKIANPGAEEQPAQAFCRAPSVAEITAARMRLAGRVRTTPLLAPCALAEALGMRVALKCEQFQATGAFKARGATNAVQSLGAAARARGVATHSSGNHGAALAWAARAAGVKATIIVPANAVETKRAAIRRYGGDIVDCGPTQADREARLAEVVAASGAIVIHPYDDARVIAGQASATIELLEAEPGLERLLVPIGGGGLASGAILAARALSRRIEVIGVEPAGADDTRRSLAAGERVALKKVETLADGLRAQVGVATFPVLREGLSDLVTVSDVEILAAMRWAAEAQRLVIEPSAATVLAALLTGKVAAGPKPTGAIVSGGNLDFSGEVWSAALRTPLAWPVA
jgi:threonine dehydratase